MKLPQASYGHMRPFIAALSALIGVAGAAYGQEWRDLSGPEIGEALIGVTLEYDDAWQEFRADGSTLYNAGGDSLGYWRVEQDRYCSQWPPRETWVCYGVQQTGGSLRFVDAAGGTTAGRVLPR